MSFMPWFSSRYSGLPVQQLVLLITPAPPKEPDIVIIEWLSSKMECFYDAQCQETTEILETICKQLKMWR